MEACKTSGGAGGGQTPSESPRRWGRAPVGPAPVAAILAEPERLEPIRGGFEIAHRLFTGSGEIAEGCLLHVGDLPHGELPCTGEPGPWHGVPAVGVEPVARFLGHPGGRDPPTLVALLGERAIEPIATGAGFLDQEKRLGLGWYLADEGVEVRLAGANGTQIGDFGAVLWRPVGDAHRLFGDLHADEEWARLGPG
jgi:hypothetical protein